MQRVAVTGATGFLGGRLVRRLQDLGTPVTGFGRDLLKGQALEAGGIRFMKLDLQNSVDGLLLPEADVFVHAAALSSQWGPADLFRRVNVAGTKRAIDLARRMGVRRFIFISSPSVTFRLKDCTGIRESDPLPAPVNAYAASKGEAERIVREAEDLSPVILRPRAIYGRGDVALLPRLLRAAENGPLPRLRGGRAVTQLTHVDDVVGAILSAVDSPVCFRGGTYHVAGPEILPVTEIAERACRRAGVVPRWRDVPWPVARFGVQMIEAAARLSPQGAEPRITLFGLGLFAFSQTLDTSAIASDLGFTPKIRFTAGLDEVFGSSP